MAEYTFRCVENQDHLTTREYPMGEAPDEDFCEHCLRPARRLFAVPIIIEKNTGYDNRGNKLQNKLRMLRGETKLPGVE